MKQIVFVDDDTNILSGLKRLLRPMRQKWHMQFVDSAEKALAILKETPVDIVVSDIRMPDMDGSQLFLAILEKWPDTVRIILSGSTDQAMVLGAVNVAHQFLPKPCDATVLLSTLNRACDLSDLLKSSRLKRLVSGMTSLPSLPGLYLEIVRILKSEDPSIHKIGEVIGQDIAMTAKILQLASSAFFGLPRHISSITNAVSLLGIDTIKALVLTIKIFSQFDTAAMKHLKIESISEHCIRVGHLARSIALDTGADKQCAGHSFLAGNLHDIGKIVMAVNQPEKYKKAMGLMGNDAMSGIEREHDLFEATHSEIGAYLLGNWGLPDPIVEAVTYHHQPGATKTTKITPVIAVHIADALDNHRRNPKGVSSDLDMDLLQSIETIDLANNLEHWQAADYDYTR